MFLHVDTKNSFWFKCFLLYGGNPGGHRSSIQKTTIFQDQTPMIHQLSKLIFFEKKKTFKRAKICWETRIRWDSNFRRKIQSFQSVGKKFTQNLL